MKYNLFAVIPSAWTAEVLASCGFDSITLDMQHGLISYDSALAMMQAIRGSGTRSFVRLRWNEPSHIMQMLDAGAEGLICPMIKTAEDVQNFVSACCYPPLGERSLGPLRASLSISGEYFENYLDHLSIFPMIETAEALNNIEEIASVPRITGLFVGPYDLSISMGIKKPGDFEHPALLEALVKISDVCHKKALVAGAHTIDLSRASLLQNIGFELLSFGSDSALLGKGARETLRYLKNPD